MLTLYRFRAMWGLTAVSAFVTKVETYLRMAGIPYRMEDFPLLELGQTAKGKLPIIEDNGKRIADSGFIIDYLAETYGDKLDGNLSLEQKAMSLAIRRMLEENLSWVIVHLRWVIDDNWNVFMDQLFEGFEDQALLEQIMPQLRQVLLSQLHGHGIGRHSEEELWQIGKSDVTALSHLLGDKPYFMGSEPTSLDASAFGVLAQLRNHYATPIRTHIDSLDNLVAYCERIKTRYFSDWKPEW